MGGMAGNLKNLRYDRCIFLKKGNQKTPGRQKVLQEDKKFYKKIMDKIL